MLFIETKKLLSLRCKQGKVELTLSLTGSGLSLVPELWLVFSPQGGKFWFQRLAELEVKLQYKENIYKLL